MKRPKINEKEAEVGPFFKTMQANVNRSEVMSFAELSLDQYESSILLLINTDTKDVETLYQFTEL